MSETTQVRYVVRRRFKYFNKWLMPGDPFVPKGGRFDEGIMRSNLVRLASEDFRTKHRIGPRARRSFRMSKRQIARINSAKFLPKDAKVAAAAKVAAPATDAQADRRAQKKAEREALKAQKLAEREARKAARKEAHNAD